MLKVARGDERAFAQLFSRHQGSVARFAFRFVNDRAKAEELSQDIFVKVYRNARSYRPSAKFKTFLFRVAANHCLNELRRGEYKSETVTDAVPEQTSHEAPDKTVEGKELEAAVVAGLSQMTDRERAAFTMCRFEGMAYRDIAEALSASEPAVKSLIHRATLVVAKKIEALQSGELKVRSRA